jgi:hypothetical protein
LLRNRTLLPDRALERPSGSRGTMS